jgi:hypothetical protein
MKPRHPLRDTVGPNASSVRCDSEPSAAARGGQSEAIRVEPTEEVRSVRIAESVRSARMLRDRSGYVLVQVLAACMVLSSVALAVQANTQRAVAITTVLREDLAPLIAERTAARLALAVQMVPWTRPGRLPSTTFRLGNATYVVTAVSEDLKPDVNHADPALIEAFLADVVDERTLAVVRERLHRRDSISRVLADPRELLPSCMRWTASAGLLRERLTVATRRPTLARYIVGADEIRRIPGATRSIADLLLSMDGGDTVDLSDPRLSSVSRHLGPSSGLYSTVVEWTIDSGRRGSTRFLVARGNGTSRILSTEAIYPAIDEGYCGDGRFGSR